LHRDLLLAGLHDYGVQHAHEIDAVRRFEAFVRAQADCFERGCVPGHITGSAWVTDPNDQRVLLTHHRKLNIWVQLGGHSDGDSDSLSVALREATEESGLAVEAVSERIFDIDCHQIPARKGEPAHLHYDVRFWLRARSTEFTVTEESHALRWLSADELEQVTSEESVMRMRAKWLAG